MSKKDVITMRGDMTVSKWAHLILTLRHYVRVFDLYVHIRRASDSVADIYTALHDACDNPRYREFVLSKFREDTSPYILWDYCYIQGYWGDDD